MRARGFTLIEVLLAMMLLSIVMYIGSLSFSIFSERWSKELGGFNDEVIKARNILLLRKVLKTVSNHLYQSEKDEVVYFFKGNSKSVAFVTNEPIFNSDKNVLVKLTITAADNGEEQLWYSESNLALLSSDALTPERSLLLLQDNDIRFNFYGWQSVEDFNAYFENRTAQPQWSESYNAAATRQLPYAINLSWAKNEPIIIPLSSDYGYKARYHYDESN